MKKEVLFYRFKVIALRLVILLILQNGLAYAQEPQIILCPHNEITVGIMTPLSQDWWNTPQLARLSGAQIRQVGGEPVLTCLYQVYGKEIAIMKRLPESMMSCQIRASHFSFICEPEKDLSDSNDLQGKICMASIQDKIAWDYEGRKHWQQSNLENICKNAIYSLQPGICFNRIMHGNVSHGGGTRWRWPPALRLCAGTQNANSTIACFTQAVEQKKPWPEAIELCRVTQ